MNQGPRVRLDENQGRFLFFRILRLLMKQSNLPIREGITMPENESVFKGVMTRAKVSSLVFRF